MRHDAVAFIGITIEKDPQGTIGVIDNQLFELKLNNLFISVPIISSLARIKNHLTTLIISQSLPQSNLPGLAYSQDKA